MNDNRLELKYLINKFDSRKVINLLKSLPINIKEKYDSRQVNNIYFDTQNNHSLVEHLNGIKNRYKIRIRWYGKFYDFLNPILEFKIKKNKITCKKKIKINLKDKKNYLFSKLNLINLLKETLVKNSIVNFSNNLKISRIICYKRNYYESTSEKVRFTLDTDLKYKLFSSNNLIFEDSSRKFTQKNFNILELKCNYEIKDLVPFIEKNIFIKNQSFSKFVDYRY